MHWTVDWAVQGRAQSFTLRGKHPDAGKIDPIRFQPRFNFDPADVEAVAVKEQLDDVMAFGGSIELEEQYFRGFGIDASDEARLLLAGMDQPGQLTIQAVTTALPKPVRATVEIQGPDPRVDPTRTDVWFRHRTAGSTGVLLSGEDPAGAVAVELRVPFRDENKLDGVMRTGAKFNISFDSPWNYEADDVIPLLRMHTAMQRGGQLTIRVQGSLLCTTEVPASGDDAVDHTMLLRIATVVQRLERLVGMRLRLPDGATLQQLEMAEAAVAAQDADDLVEAPFDGITASIVPGQVRNFIGQLPDDVFAMHSSNPDFMLTLGDLEIPYGPLAIWMPQVRLANRTELIRDAEGEEPIAEFKASEMPIFFRHRAFAEELASSDARSG
jgi:hypothetical protein